MIEHMRVANFKCFQDQQFEFGNITLLAGLNGMGKSSVLQALLLLRQSYQQGLLPESGLALNGELVNIGLAEDALFEGAHKEHGDIGFTLLCSDEDGVTSKDDAASWIFNYKEQVNVLPLVSEPVEPDNRMTSLFSDHFHYIEAERIGPRRFLDMSDYYVNQHRQIGKQGEYVLHFLEVFGENAIAGKNVPQGGLPSVLHPDAASTTLRDQLEGWLQDIRPGTRLHLDAYPTMNVLGLHVSFAQQRTTSRAFRATNTGFGLSYTLPVLVAILSAKPGSLLLLENPEAHLHPKGQAKLGELMALAANDGVQILVETHSDHVLNGIRVATYQKKISPKKIRLYFFESQLKDNILQAVVASPKIDHQGRIDTWPAGFFDVWDDYLDKLLLPIEGEEEDEEEGYGM